MLDAGDSPGVSLPNRLCDFELDLAHSITNMP
jgi:hypothetical protein